jgi:bla regulator protein BlaR1
MSAAWVVFVLVTSRVLTTGARFAHGLAAAARRPTRFVWLGTMLLTVTWPLIALEVLHVARTFPGLAARWSTGDPRYIALIAFALPSGDVERWLETAFVAAWATASTILLVRLAVNMMISYRWRRALPLAVVDGVLVRMSPEAGPALAGLLQMEVVLPAWVRALDVPAQRLVVGHELAHRDARDPWLLWSAAVLAALMPWNPLLWWQAGRLRLAIEADCDARVLRRGVRPSEYARLLLHIAERTVTVPRLAPALVSGATHLEYRIAAMSRDATRVSAWRRVMYALAVTGAVLLALVLRAPELPGALVPARSDVPAPTLVVRATFVPLRYDASGGRDAARMTTIGRVMRIVVERSRDVR